MNKYNNIWREENSTLISKVPVFSSTHMLALGVDENKGIKEIIKLWMKVEMDKFISTRYI